MTNPTNGGGSSSEAVASGEGGDDKGAVAPTGGGESANAGEDKTGKPAEAGGTEGGSDEGAVASDSDQGGDGDLRERNKQLESENATLRRELNDAVGRRKTASTKAETSESELKAEQASHEQTRRELRTKEVVEAILADIPAAHHKHAKDTILAMGSRGTDLGAEDTGATAKSVAEALKKGYPEYYEESSGMPRIPGSSNGVRRQSVGGVTNAEGERIL